MPSNSRSSARGPIRYKLDNGLTVVLQENHGAPVAAFNVWVRAGSAEETEPESGIAHVHEHMLFKGTARRGVGEIARVVESSGGHINAYTSFDQTVYYDVIASRYFETGLDVLADAVQHSSFDPAELAKEKEVVLEEIKRGEDMPGSKLSKSLFASAYREHPYGRPIIGSEAHVRSFTREMILSFYKRWYVPNNMVLVAVGDFKTSEIRPLIERAFAGFQPDARVRHQRPPEPEQRELRLAVVPDGVRQGYLMMAWPTCDLLHPDTPALDVLAIVLGQGDSSRLYRKVKARQMKVHEVRAHAYPLRDPGLFLISSLIEPVNALAAQSAMLHEAFLLRESLVSAAELEKAKINLEADTIYDKETVQGQALKLGYFEALAGDIAYEAEYMRRLAALTAEDVRSAARRYFDAERLSVAYLLPSATAARITQPRVAEAAAAALKSASRTRAAAKPRARRAGGKAALLAELASHVGEAGDYPVHRETLPNGVRLIIKESHAVPLVAIRSVMQGGLAFESAATNGISDFVGTLLTKGTRRRSAERIAEEIERIAGSIEGHSGRNSLGVEIEVLSPHFDRAVDLMAEVLREPAFHPREIEKTRRDTLAAISRRQDNLGGYAIDLFTSTLYRRHPYRLSSLGTPRSVKSFTRARLREFYARVAVPENLVISVVGDVRTQEVVKRFRRAFGSMKKRPFSRPRAPVEKRPAAQRYRELHRDKAQAHLVYGFPGTTVNDPDKYPLEVMSSVMAGQGGRLFLELRDRQSLAYSVTFFTVEGVDPGYIGVYMATSPGKIRRALAGVRRELSRITKEKIAPEELDRAKRNIVGGYEIDLQRAGAQAGQLAINEIFELGLEEYRAFPEKILAVTADDVLRVARRYLTLRRPVIALIRPPNPRRPSPPSARRSRRAGPRSRGRS
ncbi:MAG: pitrilysin family protein [Deltaproteobacteria bacterium]|nr:pitrilysin family protein [Deltaproteobacteria bacterium]